MRKSEVEKVKLSLEPQRISNTEWYYEEGRGLNFYNEIWIDGKYIRTDRRHIPWKMLMKSFSRYIMSRK